MTTACQLKCSSEVKYGSWTQTVLKVAWARAVTRGVNFKQWNLEAQ